MEWMAWSLVTAIFFIGIATLLIAMTVAEIKHPSVERKGFLPIIATTRGDRLFIGLLSSAFFHLGFLALSESSVWIPFGISILWLICVLRWG